jgi:uncharacterized protein (DUF983 family)
LAGFNVGDGPAAFLTMIIGAVVVILAVWLQLSVGPPWWVHVLLWVPLTTLGVVFGLAAGQGARCCSRVPQSRGEGRERQ